jgi:hypothetical protein
MKTRPSKHMQQPLYTQKQHVTAIMIVRVLVTLLLAASVCAAASASSTLQQRVDSVLRALHEAGQQTASSLAADDVVALRNLVHHIYLLPPSIVHALHGVPYNATTTAAAATAKSRGKPAAAANVARNGRRRALSVQHGNSGSLQTPLQPDAAVPLPSSSIPRGVGVTFADVASTAAATAGDDATGGDGPRSLFEAAAAAKATQSNAHATRASLSSSSSATALLSSKVALFPPEIPAGKLAHVIRRLQLLLA